MDIFEFKFVNTVIEYKGHTYVYTYINIDSNLLEEYKDLFDKIVGKYKHRKGYSLKIKPEAIPICVCEPKIIPILYVNKRLKKNSID